MTRKPEPNERKAARMAKTRKGMQANGWCYIQVKAPVHLKQAVRDLVTEFVKGETE